MNGGPEDRFPGWTAAVLRFFGALLWGKRPEDKLAQKRAGIGAAFTVVVVLLLRADGRNDKLVANMREDSQAATKALLASAKSNLILAQQLQESTEQAKRTYSELLLKIPDAKPPARSPMLKPEPGTPESRVYEALIPPRDWA